MTVKPIFTHGLDGTELPGIAGWMDKLLATAFEQTLVEDQVSGTIIAKGPKVGRLFPIHFSIPQAVQQDAPAS